jgi:hypothetical protein
MMTMDERSQAQSNRMQMRGQQQWGRHYTGPLSPNTGPLSQGSGPLVPRTGPLSAGGPLSPAGGMAPIPADAPGGIIDDGQNWWDRVPSWKDADELDDDAQLARIHSQADTARTNGVDPMVLDDILSEANDVRFGIGVNRDELKIHTAFGMPELPAPMAMAKGGSMKPGKRPYVVGEEGPELVLPRQDGSFHVVPADATAMMLPQMTAKPVGRARGGPMVPMMRPGEYAAPSGLLVESEMGTQAGIRTPYGSGFADRSGQGMIEPARPYIADERGEVDTMALRRGAGQNVTTPYIPDSLAGTPFGTANGAMMAPDRGPNQSFIESNLRGLEMAPGAVRVPSDLLTMEQRAQGANAGMAMGERLNMLREQDVQGQRAAQDAGLEMFLPPDQGQPGAGMPMGPLAGMRPGAVRRSERALEKAVRTPQGAMWAADRGSEAQMQAQQIAAAQAAAGAGTTWQPMMDPNTGRPFALVNDRGQSINLPAMKADEEIIFVDTQQPDPLGIGMVTVREPRIYNRSTRQMQAIPMGGGPVAGAPAAGGETGGAAADPAKPGQAPVKVMTAADYEKVPKGALYTDPKGVVRTKK